MSDPTRYVCDLVIQQRRPMMNLEPGLTLDPSWTPFVRPRSDSYVTGSATSGGPTPIREESFRSTSTCS